MTRMGQYRTPYFLNVRAERLGVLNLEILGDGPIMCVPALINEESYSPTPPVGRRLGRLVGSSLGQGAVCAQWYPNLARGQGT